MTDKQVGEEMVRLVLESSADLATKLYTLTGRLAEVEVTLEVPVYMTFLEGMKSRIRRGQEMEYKSRSLTCGFVEISIPNGKLFVMAKRDRR